VIGAGVLGRLRRRDPDHRIVLRAVRLSLAALPAYYVCLYGIGNGVLATYVVFGVIAAGAFVKLHGSARVRARILLMVLPVIWSLIAVGTVLDVNIWGSVAATLVVGFSIAFFGVGGPRLVGLAGGLQLFFIVANFPPHHANALPARLIGATVGVVLTALGEVLLWPDPEPVSYRRRLAQAAEAVAGLMEASADVVAGRSAGDGEMARCQDRVTQAVEQTRMTGLPRNGRPLSAGRRDRALRDGAAAIQEIAEQVRRLSARPDLAHGRHADVADLLRHCAAAMRRAGRTLVDGRPPPAASPQPGDASERDLVDIDELDHFRLHAFLRTTLEHVRILAVAADVAVGAPIPSDGQPPGGSDAFWYARHNEVSLFWRQFRVHLTPRSVYFQGALRLAVALAGARAVAGEFDLSHGFWVLLGTLTIMRTSAASTRTTLFSAAVGTLIGAVVSGLLLSFTDGAPGYAVELALATLLAFALGPMLGLAWSQAFLTLMITLVFAQLAPADWSLARVRLMDVLVGGSVGIVAGVMMWPRGAGGELRRRMAAYLKADADLIDETVAALVGAGDRMPGALRPARREFILADASLNQYYQERPDPRMSQIHWEATMVAGQHIVHGAELVLRHNPPGSLNSAPEAAAALCDIAARLRRGYLDFAGELPGGRISRPVVTEEDGAAIAGRVTGVVATTGAWPQRSRLIEVEQWLVSLSENLDWIQTTSGLPPRPQRPGHG
jgi:uncharacterized membrane protein YccC